MFLFTVYNLVFLVSSVALTGKNYAMWNPSGFLGDALQFVHLC